jgi:hypothetical protein
MKDFEMKRFGAIVTKSICAGALGVACAGADFEDLPTFEEELGDEIGSLEQPLCENKGGTNAVMTAIAVAAGKELGRWLPERDFRWNSSTGMLELSEHAAPRCRGVSPTGTCVNTQALLDMQKPAAHGKVTFPGGIVLDSNLLKQKLKDGWNSQMSCGSTCTSVPTHDLRYSHVENGSCDKKFFFDPFYMGTSNRMSTTDQDRLKNKLRFVGYPSNKMLNFYLRNGQVSVDPTYGLNEGTTVTAGSCDTAFTKFSTSDISGRCCNPNGVVKKYVRSAFSTSLYLCQ